jgi:hypothetical protein
MCCLWTFQSNSSLCFLWTLCCLWKCLSYSSVLPLNVSVLRQSVLPWTYLSYSCLNCLLTCLSYCTPASPDLHESILQQAVLPRSVFPAAACADFGRVCPAAACDPLDVPVQQQPELPLTYLSYSSPCCRTGKSKGSTSCYRTDTSI